MSLDQLALSPDEQARFHDVSLRLPNEVRAVRAAILAIITDAVGPFEGRIMAESEIDALLTSLIEPIVAYLTETHRDADILSLITRDAVLRAREHFVRQLIIAKHN